MIQTEVVANTGSFRLQISTEKETLDNARIGGHSKAASTAILIAPFIMFSQSHGLPAVARSVPGFENPERPMFPA